MACRHPIAAIIAFGLLRGLFVAGVMAFCIAYIILALGRAALSFLLEHCA